MRKGSKKLKKYQLAGTNPNNEPVKENYNWMQVGSNIPQRPVVDDPTALMDISKNTTPIDPITAGTPQQEKLGLLDPRRTELHPGVQMANYAMQGVTGIADFISNIRASKDEKMQYLNEITPQSYENMERYGLNKNPVFTKFGGAISKFFFGGGEEDPKKKAAAVYKTQAEVDAANAFARNFAARKFKDNSGAINPEQTYVAKNPGDVKVPFIDAETGLPFVDKSMPVKKAFNVPYWVTLDDIKGDGNNYGYEDRSGRWIDVDSSVLNSERFRKTPQQANNDVASLGRLQLGGKTNNLIEAEKGEVIESVDGEINTLPNNAPTHEDGGIIVPDAHRVLENTSSLRNDKNSKYLKLSPEKIKGLTGLDTNKSMSHAQALDEAAEVNNDLRIKILKKIDLASKNKKNLDKLAENSIKLNLNTAKSIPSTEEIFDTLFEHQEGVKNIVGIDAGQKAKVGGKYQFGAYVGSKNKLKTPAGNPDSFPSNLKFDDFLKELGDRGFKYEGINDNKTLQTALYDYKLQKGELDDIKNMWAEGMHQTGMVQAKKLGFVDDKGVFKKGVLDNPENLKQLASLYPDGMLGPRLLRLAGNKKPRIWTEDEPSGTNPAEPQDPVDTSIHANIKRVPKVESKFHEPLRWFDVASPLNAYMSALERIPEKYNGIEFNQLRYKLQDPTAQLQQNQADFNAATEAIQNTQAGVGAQMANIANLAASKYSANQQVLGNTENQNAQIKNNEITYNTQVRDRQGIADQQAREVFEDKVLGSKAKQQEQKLTALDSLYKTIAENRALNRNGNLMMKFSRAFDQYGDYNGYQHLFGINPAAGVPATTENKPDSAGGISGLTPGKSYYNRKTGKTLYFDGNNLLER